jgi:phenol hydroxylase P4 protein
MTVNALSKYAFKSRDALENFNGKQLIYVNWEMHRMFSRPFVLALPPATPFSVIVDKYIAECYGYHPDFKHIDWNAVVWRNSNTVFTPDPSKSLKDNGIGHKDLIRFTTPGLNGIAGSGY